MCEYTTGYKLTVDMCHTVKRDWYCIVHHPQNLNSEFENAGNLHTMGIIWSDGYTCGNLMETVRQHFSHYELQGGALLHWIIPVKLTCPCI